MKSRKYLLKKSDWTTLGMQGFQRRKIRENSGGDIAERCYCMQGRNIGSIRNLPFMWSTWSVAGLFLIC